MARLLHLSDLHFGRTRPGLLQPLVDAAWELKPDATLISGDLTQRAREWQFEAAANLIADLPQPVLTVPGNHDIPLDLPISRFLRSFAAYKSDISRDLEPMLDLPGVRIVAMNTAWPFAFEHGRVRSRSLSRAVQRLREAPPGVLRVVMLHHPLVHPPGARKEPMQNGERAAHALSEAGADLVLSGHLHTWGAAADMLREGRRSMLQVSAGTGLSTRLRGEDNDFNLIETLSQPPVHALRVTRYVAKTGGDGFTPGATADFVEGEAGWRPAD